MHMALALVGAQAHLTSRSGVKIDWAKHRKG